MELDIQVNQAHPLLTKKEKVVLQFRAMGLTKKEMAERLHRSVATIVTHDMHMREKLGATNAAQAVSFSVAMGILTITEKPAVESASAVKGVRHSVASRATGALMVFLSVLGVVPSADVMAADWLMRGAQEQPFQRMRSGTRLRGRLSARGRSGNRKRDEVEPGDVSGGLVMPEVFDVR